LIKIKRNTGIENWNVICRWALCLSLNEKTPPPKQKVSNEQGIEMTWKVFGGEFSDIYAALLIKSKEQHQKISMDDSSYLHAHIRRGLGYLASGTDMRSIEFMIQKWIGDRIK
jgi:DNA sulfur modification protein DndE